MSERTMDDWMQQYLDAWNSHDGANVAAFMADDATYEDLALGVIHEGRDAIKAFVDETEQFSKDYKFTSVSEQASGDRYAFEWEVAGTNTGEVAGLRATNKSARRRSGAAWRTVNRTRSRRSVRSSGTRGASPGLMQ